LRRYEESAASYGQVIRDSTPPGLRLMRGLMFLSWQGTVDTLEAALRGADVRGEREGRVTWSRVQVARIRRSWRAVLPALDESPVPAYYTDTQYRPWSLMRAEARAALGDTRGSRAEYENALAMLADIVQVHPDDLRYRVALGLAYAGLGRREEATAESRRILTHARPSETGIHGIEAIAGAVEVLVRAGAIDAALEQLDILFTMPAGIDVSAARLRVDPTYDPLRADRRFHQLIQRYETSASAPEGPS
jgi:tetratricopeptide (TPR) repeat protein